MVDVFKINESIFLNTINESLGKSTFYKNINPIQCRNYINEHMGVNVAPLFEDVLPDQEMLKKNIDDKKKEYEEYIKDLEEKRDTLENMKSEASDTKDIDDAIDLINKEIEDTKADYKKYQKDDAVCFSFSARGNCVAGCDTIDLVAFYRGFTAERWSSA